MRVGIMNNPTIFSEINIIHEVISKNGSFPNNSNLPLLIYQGCFVLEDSKPEIIEEIFFKNAWKGLWRDGIYDFHHYHSNTHEALGIYSGSCEVQIGGENGKIFELKKGDVL